MSTAIPVHVALVDDTKKLGAAYMSELAGALSEQIQADFAPVWHTHATVGAYPEAPPNTWAVHIQDSLDEPGALGYHTDSNKQPVAYVMATDTSSVTVSHEVLEMLADPFGSRMHAAQLPPELSAQAKEFGLKSASERVHYLLEVCDPCEATSYQVGGVALSDFLLPAWYRSGEASRPVSHVSLTHPREVAGDGYVSFANSSGDWFQVFNEGGEFKISSLGQFNAKAKNSGSLREWTDAKSRAYRAKKRR